MKRLIVATLLAAAGGAAVWRQMQSDKAEQDLWAEATDPVS